MPADVTPAEATPVDAAQAAQQGNPNRRLAWVLLVVLAVATLALIAVGPAEAESCGEGAVHLRWTPVAPA